MLPACGLDGIAEIKSAMTAETGGASVVEIEQDLAAFSRLGNRARVVCKMETVIGRRGGDNGPFERGQSLRHVRDGIGVRFSREGLRKKDTINRVGANQFEQIGLYHAKL